MKPGVWGGGGWFVLFQVVKGNVMAGSSTCGENKAQSSLDNSERARIRGTKVSHGLGEKNCSEERPLCCTSPAPSDDGVGIRHGGREGKG